MHGGCIANWADECARGVGSSAGGSGNLCNAAKQKFLGVRDETLAQHGAGERGRSTGNGRRRAEKRLNRIMRSPSPGLPVRRVELLINRSAQYS